jgi:beta-lactamase regulating signal transducer with metallopeptidase domain/polyhydroxyalkanoate synthesis regulator phasin
MTVGSFSGMMLESAAGNLAIALPLGLIAWWLQRRGTQPFLAHLFWLVVLVKLVTPPLYSFRIETTTDPVSVGVASSYVSAPGPASALPDPGWLATLDWQVVAVAVWLVGSLLALAWSLSRAWRFHRLLGVMSEPAALRYQQAASRIAATLGLRRAPPVMATAANIAPMVWWIGGAVRIYVPRSMLREMSEAELCDILAHELGHVGRGDHYVRWLECLVGVALWWNPVAWWARCNLRVCEEICCDAFVLSKTEASRDGYAGALVSAMELLATPTIRPGGLASHVNGGFIERRIRMILSGQTLVQTPRWLRGLVVASAALLLPLGFTLAQDDDDLEKVRQWLESGVNSAYLTQEQADIMLQALKNSASGTMTIVDGDGNVIKLNRRIVAVAGDGAANVARANAERAMALAAEHFRAQAEQGKIAPEEAKAIVADITDAIAAGQMDGAAYYDRQFETGVIDRETAERRKRMIEDMEQAIALGQGVSVQVGPEELANGQRVVKVAAFPVDVDVDQDAVLDFELVRLDGESTEIDATKIELTGTAAAQ